MTAPLPAIAAATPALLEGSWWTREPAWAAAEP
ncbi:hypothetical protein ABIA38_009055 [Embleya sp. AB8]